MFLLIYIGCSLMIGIWKAVDYTTSYPHRKEMKIATIFFSAFLVATVFAPLVIIDFIIGGIKRVKFHKQNVPQE